MAMAGGIFFLPPLKKSNNLPNKLYLYGIKVSRFCKDLTDVEKVN